ncbi:hypothetical protein BU16DRAFT_621878 [Lophium mytilinum]|uniref:Ig-like domain-containing protein n=1 Tax=Lophium mytilinum TaxID=390894 RepID=A0A6A6QDZ3_9PEZI|nr:hypothetical protein BU16DRAFT_621878 [Lophium mytilinum]
MLSLSWPTIIFLAAAVPGFCTINSQSDSIIPNAPSVTVRPSEIQLCDDSVSVCKSKFERVQTVYQHNSTVTEVQWQTSTTVLPVSTHNVTEIVVVTSIQTTITDGLCDEVHTVTHPGTSVVTVSVNATSVRSIVPRTTATIKTTITQYETASSVCRIKETSLIPFPIPTLAPMPPPPQQPVVQANASQSPNAVNEEQHAEDEGEAIDIEEHEHERGHAGEVDEGNYYSAA